jgi:peptidyl-prolyl cis-trans isomerase SurA
MKRHIYTFPSLRGGKADVAIQQNTNLDCFASLAMTKKVAAYKYFILLFFIAVCFVFSAGHTAAAQDVYAAIKVNGATITNFDIQTRAKLLQLQRIGAAQAKAQAEQELIDETLQIQEAKRLNIVAGESEVDAAMAQIASQSNASPARFESELRRVGVDPNTLRSRIRAALSWRNVIQARFRATINIREEDVVAAMLETQGQEKAAQDTVTEYTLQQIIFVTPENASQGVKNQRRNEAAALRSRFTSCGSSLDIARNLNSVVVKDAGRRFSADIPEALAKKLDETPTGKLTPPEIERDGVVMIAVCDKRQISGRGEASREVEDQLRSEEGQLMARGYIRDLRANATIIRN